LAQSEVKQHINQEWTTLKNVIEKAACEALGKKNKHIRKRGLKIWKE
jgi:hypothetical protein